MPTILAIDYGIKRIGLAIVPDGLSVVMPFGTVTEQQVIAKIQEAQPDMLVIGLPLDMEGQETDMSARIRAFGETIRQAVHVPIEYVDERFSTAQGKRSEGGVGDDEKAAMVILETYLSSQPIVHS